MADKLGTHPSWKDGIPSLHRDKAKALLLLALLSTLLFTLCGCATSSTVVDQDAEVVKASIELAEQYCELGLYDDAVAVYDKALNQTNDYRLIYNKAIAQALDGNLETAVSTLQDGGNEFPYILSFKTAQAKLLQELGLVDEAIACYLEVLALNPYDTTTRKELIAICMESGLVETAHEQALILWKQGYISTETLSLIKESM